MSITVRKSVFQVLFGITLILSFGNCRGPKAIINATPYELDCPQVIDYGPARTEIIDSVYYDSNILSNYSQNSLMVANAYGLIPYMVDLAKLREMDQNFKSGDSIRIAILQKEKEIDKILDLASLELESYENFLECNILNLFKVRSLLSDENSRIRGKYTNAAVIVGLASAAIVGGIILSSNEKLQDGHAIDWIGIGGAVIAAYLAIYSERIDKKVALKLQKNLFTPIFTGKNDNNIFSDRYWYLMNSDYFNDSTSMTVRDYILNTWEQSNKLLGADKNKSYLPILLDDEGTYTEELLLLRIDMLEEIKKGIDLISKSLYILNFEID